MQARWNFSKFVFIDHRDLYWLGTRKPKPREQPFACGVPRWNDWLTSYDSGTCSPRLIASFHCSDDSTRITSTFFSSSLLVWMWKRWLWFIPKTEINQPFDRGMNMFKANQVNTWTTIYVVYCFSNPLSVSPIWANFNATHERNHNVPTWSNDESWNWSHWSVTSCFPLASCPRSSISCCARMCTRESSRIQPKSWPWTSSSDCPRTATWSSMLHWKRWQWFMAPRSSIWSTKSAYKLFGIVTVERYWWTSTWSTWLWLRCTLALLFWVEAYLTKGKHWIRR